MSGYQYKHLSADQQAAIRDRLTKKPEPVIDDALRAAWEADLYAHSVLAESKTGKDKAPHLQAMAEIERALKASGSP